MLFYDVNRKVERRGHFRNVQSKTQRMGCDRNAVHNRNSSQQKD